MNSSHVLTLAKWPFFLADGLFVLAAGTTIWLAERPAPTVTVVAAVLLLVVGALVSVLPYALEFYWRSQQLEADLQERAEAQGRALEKALAQMAAVNARAEASGGQAGAILQEAARMGQEIQQLAGTLQQLQAGIDEQQARLQAERAESVQSEEEKRPEPDPIRAEGDEKPPGLPREKEPADADVPPTPVEESAEAVPEKLTESAPAPAANGSPSAVMEDAVAPPKRQPASGGSRAPKIRVSRDSGASLFESTILVATAFIGASNVLCLRGDGPGLSWEKGVPMQGVEAGKWSWTTTDATGPVRFQVYKNDDEPDKEGVLTIEPGQRLDIRPEF